MGDGEPRPFWLVLRGDDARARRPRPRSRVVLLHGWLQSHTCWLRTALFLSARSALGQQRFRQAGTLTAQLMAADQSIMQKCSCFLACPNTEERVLAHRAAKLLVPLLVRFFEQHLGSSASGPSVLPALGRVLTGRWTTS